MSDLISRQSAIDEVINLWADKPFGNPALVEIKDCIEALPPAQPVKHGRWNNHEVACLIADLFGDPCACNFNGIDEWLPTYCDFSSTCCPHPDGVACWEQYLKHLDKRHDEVSK